MCTGTCTPPVEFPLVCTDGHGHGVAAAPVPVGLVPALGLQLKGEVLPKEPNHKVLGNSDTDRVRNPDLHTSTGSVHVWGGYIY